jgi:hypothetical protein
MTRVTPADVRLLLADTELSDTVITAFITSATNLIDSAFSTYTVSETILTEIEKWLTAHMIASTVERMAIKEGAEGAEITYTGKFGQLLSSTPYGQMVLTLDATGVMASLGGKSVSIIAIKNFDG